MIWAFAIDFGESLKGREIFSGYCQKMEKNSMIEYLKGYLEGTWAKALSGKETVAIHVSLKKRVFGHFLWLCLFLILSVLQHDSRVVWELVYVQQDCTMAWLREPGQLPDSRGFFFVSDTVC